MSKQCIECEQKFIGRLDKKFCGDQCRSAYNNRLNSDSSSFMRNINNILRKNRRILESLNPEEKTKVRREDLLDHGFKFSYFTNEYITMAGKVYRFCYDQGYLEIGNDWYAIVRRKKYVE